MQTSQITVSVKLWRERIYTCKKLHIIEWLRLG